jgi:hypothetical protein
MVFTDLEYLISRSFLPSFRMMIQKIIVCSDKYKSYCYHQLLQTLKAIRHVELAIRLTLQHVMLSIYHLEINDLLLCHNNQTNFTGKNEKIVG